jgi:hypothetical protein
VSNLTQKQMIVEKTEEEKKGSSKCRPKCPQRRKTRQNPTTDDACGLDYPCPCPLCPALPNAFLDVLIFFLLIAMIGQPPHMHKPLSSTLLSRFISYERSRLARALKHLFPFAISPIIPSVR